MNNKAYAKIGLLLLFAALTIYFIKYLDITQNLNKENIQLFVESFGILGPAIFVLIYALGIALFMPGTLLTGAGALIFGTGQGFMLNVIGATIGASLAFFISRYLGRDFARNLVGEKLKKYDDKLEKNGFHYTFYLRMIFFPFTLLNFGAGLTKMRFKDFILGTFLGILPGTFILAFFVDSITNINKFKDLFNFQILTAAALFIFSFFIPKIIKLIHTKYHERKNNLYNNTNV